MKRRALAIAVVGAAAGVAGVAAALWQARGSVGSVGGGSPAGGTAGEAGGPGSAGDAGPHGLFGMRFAQPGGGELALDRFRGRPLLVNFWATWCPPCVREMPALDRFARQFAATGWQVLGIAVDQDKPVREFLDRNPVGYSIALAGFDGMALSRSLGNDQGGLPFTVVIDRSGRVTHRHAGETQFEQLAAWATAARR